VSDYDFENDADFESDGIKNLRKQAKDLAKQNAELQGQLQAAIAASRKANINDALREIGANTKLSKYIPNEIEASVDNVRKWLEEDGDLFGYKPKSVEEAALTAPAEPVTPNPLTNDASALADAFNRVQNPDSFGGVPTQGADAQALAQMKSLAEKAGTNFWAFDDLHKGLQG
jgi:hypothetical protein